MLAGGGAASGAILIGQITGAQNLVGALSQILTQRAIASVPIAFASMIAVSLMSVRLRDAGAQMLALHAPEALGLEALEQARA
jgi:hypothetical protein